MAQLIIKLISYQENYYANYIVVLQWFDLNFILKQGTFNIIN